MTVSAGRLVVQCPAVALQPELSLVTGRVVLTGGTAGPGLELRPPGEGRAVLRPAVHLAVETLALHTVVNPALAGAEDLNPPPLYSSSTSRSYPPQPLQTCG